MILKKTLIASCKIAQKECDRLVLWAPVCLGQGIFSYLSWLNEPHLFLCGALSTLILLCAALLIKKPDLPIRIFLWSPLLWSLGFLVTALHTHLDPPLMVHRLTGPLSLQGTIQHIERLPEEDGKEALFRILLEDVKGLAPKGHKEDLYSVKLPRKIRLRIREKDFPKHTASQEKIQLTPGATVQARVLLFPLPETPSLFGPHLRRTAFFQGIGARGMVLSPLRMVSIPLESSFVSRLARIRQSLTDHLLKSLPTPYGAIASALITGETAALPSNIRLIFSTSGLAHVLAISGLHLAIVAGFVFFVLERGLALIPSLALRFPVRKIAALLALGVSATYLVLSGAAVPARRAFLMTAITLTGLILDRPAVTLRLLAVSATVILCLTPAVLLGASFQLSFAAVVGLIASHEIFVSRWHKHPREKSSIFGSLVSSLSRSFLSSTAATLATTPFTVYFFHSISWQGIFANLIAIPLMTFIVMPSAVLGILWSSLGGDCWFDGLSLLEKPLQWLVLIAEKASQDPENRPMIPVCKDWALPCVIWGGLWLALWCTRIRFLGLPLMMMGFIGLFIPHVPTYWKDGSGTLWGFFDHRTQTLWVSSARRGRWTQDLWIQTSGAKKVKILGIPQSPISLREIQNLFPPQQGAQCAWGQPGKNLLIQGSPENKRPWDLSDTRTPGNLKFPKSQNVQEEPYPKSFETRIKRESRHETKDPPHEHP